MTASNPERVLVLFSGGIDSSTLLYLARARGLEPMAVSINYGQRHSVELEHAAQHCEQLGIEHQVIDARNLSQAFGASALMQEDAELPSGEYDSDNLKVTVVPNRNMVMLAIAAATGISHNIHRLWYGAHQNDSTTYPDCRPAFVEAMQRAFSLCNEPGVKLEAPLVNMTKGQVVAQAAKLGVDFSLCWSCYRGGSRPCGECSTCVDRRAAFASNGLEDPQ